MQSQSVIEKAKTCSRKAQTCQGLILVNSGRSEAHVEFLTGLAQSQQLQPMNIGCLLNSTADEHVMLAISLVYRNSRLASTEQGHMGLC